MNNTLLNSSSLHFCSSAISQVPYPNTKEFQQSLTPDAVIEMLKSGNSRFVNNSNLDRNYMSEVETTSKSQYPWAIIHGCMDSRVRAEFIFDVGIGNVFVTEVAGNIINSDILGSMEFACQYAGSKLILIMCHSECEAVKGAINIVEMGNLTGLLEKISPSINMVVNKNKYEDKSSKNKTLVNDVAIQNVINGMNEIRASSQILHDLEETGVIKIVGAFYDISNGRVTFLDE